jgi:putative ABC transport system permease protein
LGNWSLPVAVSGIPGKDTRRVSIHQTDDGYAKVFGLAFIQGRFFNESEVAAQARVAAVNQAFVRRYFPQGQPLGQIVRIPLLRGTEAKPGDDFFQVIGVFKDSANRITTDEIAPEIFIPYTFTGRADRLVVWTQSPPLSLASAVRAQVYAVDREQPVMDVKTLEDMLNEFVYAEPRFNLLLLGVFAATGMALALFGVYGIISSTVARRTQEIGIRMALGAGLGQIAGMVVRSGARLVLLGIVAGLAGSLASVQVLSNQVMRVSTVDPYSFAAASALLLAAGLFASFWPARRAARVDPVTVLRHE